MIVRFYADENFPYPVVEQLRLLGHDVVTMLEDGRANQRIPDAAVLEIATESQRAVLTTNRKHFIRLHEMPMRHAGIVVCSIDLDFEGQAERIHSAIKALETLDDELIRINRPLI